MLNLIMKLLLLIIKPKEILKEKKSPNVEIIVRNLDDDSSIVVGRWDENGNEVLDVETFNTFVTPLIDSL